MPPDTRAWIPGYYFYYSYKHAKSQSRSEVAKSQRSQPGRKTWF